MEDPFELDQQSVDAKLKLLQDNFNRWRRLKAGAADAAAGEELSQAEDEFNWLTNEIHKSVKSIGWDLDDLGETLRRMSERGRPGADAARQRYIRDSRDLLAAVEGEVRAGAAKVADADGGGDQLRPIGDESAATEMSASTERLVESLLQQDEDDDDDVELLIREDAAATSRGRRQFSVAGPDDDGETPARRLWRRHRPAILFVCLVVLLLLIILIVSLSSGGRRQAAVPPPVTTTPASRR